VFIHETNGLLIKEIKTELIGKWVELKLVTGNSWFGRIEEWDEDAIFISNGFEFGHANHKGAECTNAEASTVELTEQREFFVK